MSNSDSLSCDYFLKLCVEELESFSYREWVVLRVPPIYLANIINEVKMLYPRYKITPYEIDGMWIDGDPWI
jgi:hypothetical protein